jgi:hypothetical protein
MSLTTAEDNLDEDTSLFISSTTQRLTLNTPVDSTPNFQLKWGGANGNTGLGADFGAGQPLDLFTSYLSFSLRGTDIPSDFAWQFTDSAGNTATYNGSFPVHSSICLPTPVRSIGTRSTTLSSREVARRTWT